MYLAVGIFVVYLVAVALLSWKGAKKTKDLESFAIAKEDVSPLVVAITFAATFMSSGIFLGVTGQAYANGVTGLWFPTSQWFPAMIGLAIMAKGYRLMSDKMKSLTLPDWVGDRYKSEFLRIFVGFAALLNISYLSAQYVGVGIVMNQLFNIPYKLGVIFGLLIVVSYVFAGGTYAHIYTNAFQGAMMVTIALAIFVSGFIVFPDFASTIYTKLNAINPSLVGTFNTNDPAFAGPLAILGIAVAHIFWSANPQLINKVQYLKSSKDIKKFVLYTSVFMFLIGLVTFGGIYARILEPGLAKPDAAIPTYVAMVFPKFISVVFLVTILAATMSTTDGIMVYLATVIGNTLYKQTVVRINESRGTPIDYEQLDKKSLLITRYSVILVGILSLPLAFQQPQFLNVLLWLGTSGLLSTVAGPVIVGIWSKRANATAASTGAILGLSTYVILYFGKIINSIYLAGGMGMTVSLLATFIACYFTKPMDEEFNTQLFSRTEQM